MKRTTSTYSALKLLICLLLLVAIHKNTNAQAPGINYGRSPFSFTIGTASSQVPPSHPKGSVDIPTIVSTKVGSGVSSSVNGT